MIFLVNIQAHGGSFFSSFLASRTYYSNSSCLKYNQKSGAVQLIEMSLDSAIEMKLRKVENVVSWARKNWHEKIASYLTKIDTEQNESAAE